MMLNNATSGEGAPKKQAFVSLLAMIPFLVLGLFAANFLGLVAALPFVDFRLDAALAVLSNPTGSPQYRTALLVLQGVTALGAFLIGPYVYVSRIDFDKFFWPEMLAAQRRAPWQGYVLTVLAVLASMPLVAWLVQWNEALKMPEWLAAFEQWASASEERLKELTLFLVNFDSFGQFLLGLLVVAVVPGIGEEFLFRGVLQNKLAKLLGNAHAAIWLSAFVFSAFHMQFYGLVPRMALGALFGYLYLWSGSLWVPMLAHFVNNGFTVLMMYLYRLGKVSTNIEDSSSATLSDAGLSAVALAFVLAVFYQQIQAARKPLPLSQPHNHNTDGSTSNER